MIKRITAIILASATMAFGQAARYNPNSSDATIGDFTFPASPGITGQLTIKGNTAGRLLIKPSSAAAANTKLFDYQTSAGSSVFSIDAEGDVLGTHFNGLTITSSTGAITIGNAKTLTISNTITLTATDGSTLAIGSGAALSALGTITPAANRIPIFTGATTASFIATGTLGRDVLAEAAPASDRLVFWDNSDGSITPMTTGAALGFTGSFPNKVIAVTDAELLAFSGLTSAADKLPYFTGAVAADVTDFSAFTRTYIDDANAATFRATTGTAATGAVGSSGITMSTAKLLGRTTASTGAVEEITVGSGLTFAGGTLSSASTGGTVTSVNVAVPSGFSVSGGPVTGSGTITITSALSGIIKGTGGAFSVATPGTDYAGITAENAFTQYQYFLRPLLVRSDKDYSVDDFEAFRFGDQFGQSLLLRWKAAGSGYFELVNAYPDSEPYPAVKLKVDGSLITSLSATNITGGILSSNNGGAGTINGILVGDGAGIVSAADGSTPFTLGDGAVNDLSAESILSGGPVQATIPALGTSPTDAFYGVNATAAAAGAQQASPSIDLLGNGWKTNATAASQSVAFRQFVLPVQGATAPTGLWKLQSNIAAAGWGDRFTVGSDGAIGLPVSGSSININSGNWVATHTSGVLTVGTGDLRVTTAGTNSASAVTVGGTQTLTNKTLTTPTISGAITLPDGVRQTFNPDATNAGINVGAQAGDPSSLTNGDLWYNSSSNALKARINGATVALGAGGGSVQVGNTVFVSKDGDDGTGARERLDLPFLTPSAAKTAASSGDTIVVFPGPYTTTAALAKDEVHWFFHAGASVTWSGITNGSGIFDDGGSAMQFRVMGNGDFVGTATSSAVATIFHTSNAASDISFKVNNMTMTTAGTAFLSSAWGEDGRLSGEFNVIDQPSSADFGYAVYWTNGPMYIKGNLVTGRDPVGFAADSTPTGDAFVSIDDIVCTEPMSAAIVTQSSQADAAIWITCKTIRSEGTAVFHTGAQRLYLTAQKIFGNVYVNNASNLFYLNADKVSKVDDQDNLTVAATGFSRIRVNHWDDNGFTGQAMTLISGQAIIEGGDIVTTTGNGILATGFMRARLKSVLLSTQSNTSGNPVNITSPLAQIILERCTIVSSKASAEQTGVVTTDEAAQYEDSGILLDDNAGTVGVWIDVDNGYTIPSWASGADRAIEVDISSSDSAATVATAIKTAVDADAQFIATNSAGNVIITDAATGLRADATAQGSGLTVYTLYQGSATNRDSIEASSPAIVRSYSSQSNSAVDGNVTISPSGGLPVDSDVR